MAVHEPEEGTALSPAMLTAQLVAATTRWKTAAMAGVFLPFLNSLRGPHRYLVPAGESLHPLTWQIAVLVKGTSYRKVFRIAAICALSHVLRRRRPGDVVS